MTTPQKMIFDCVTGETITRDFNAAELTELKLDLEQTKIEAAAKLAKQVARQAVLDKLGLNADEASALFS